MTAERTAAVTPGVCAHQDVQVAQLQAHLNEQLFPSDSIMTTYQVRNIPLLSVVPPNNVSVNTIFTAVRPHHLSQ